MANGFQDLGWTADFTEFRQKIEPIFGSLEKLVAEAPDVYAHQVLSHGFMEYEGMTGLGKKIKEEIAGSEDAFCKVLQGSETEQQKQFHEQYNNKLKVEFMKLAKENKLPENLLEDGWKEYLDD